MVIIILLMSLKRHPWILIIYLICLQLQTNQMNSWLNTLHCTVLYYYYNCNNNKAIIKTSPYARPTQEFLFRFAPDNFYCYQSKRKSFSSCCYLVASDSVVSTSGQVTSDTITYRVIWFPVQYRKISWVGYEVLSWVRRTSDNPTSDISQYL